VDLYTRRQLTLLLIIVLVAGAGIGIDRWRRAHPEVAERLEALDRAPAPAPAPPPRPAPARPERTTRAVIHAVPSPAAAPLDVNRATRDELERLPGIGPGLAGRIVDARERRGPFGSVDELRRVRGIGHTTLERLRPLLAIGPAP
jgi:competence ComEA-like helix-hairpin-helix protein